MPETSLPPFEPAAMTRILAARLEGALASETRGELEALSGRLQGMMDGFLAKATPEVVAALSGNAPEGSPLTLCYLIGQIAMGQALASQALASRPADAFFETFAEPDVHNLMNLLSSPMRAGDLSGMSGRPEADISDDLSRMEEVGLVTRTADGDTWTYARTPAAAALLAHRDAVRLPG